MKRKNSHAYYKELLQVQTLGEFTVRAKRKHQESIDLASQV